jgi:hypothetical protein
MSEASGARVCEVNEASVVIGGTNFSIVGVEQAHLVKAAGVYALCRREADGRRTVLYVDAAEAQGPAARFSGLWAKALAAGATEMAFTVGVRDPAELEALKALVIEAARPPLNERPGAREAA